MNYKNFLDKVANSLENIILTEITSVEIPTQDFGWVNKRYISDIFRIAHIERYSDNNLEVLHFTCFPNIDCGEPIFGFDIITVEKKCLACFIDLSPIITERPLQIEKKFEKSYPLPDWAKEIFSESVLAVIPNDDEFEWICENVINIFESYIDLLYNKSEDLVTQIVDNQNRYCEHQQKNERTLNVLKSKLGEENAKMFMSDILFPKIHTS